MFRFRRSLSTEELAPWIGLSAELPRMYRGALALIMISGAYLTRGVLQGLTAAARVSDLAWLEVSVAGLVVLALVGAVSVRRMRPLWHEMSTAGGEAASRQLVRAYDPLLPVLFMVRTVLALAIVFLMMSRPSLDGSLVVMAAAVVVALASSGVAWRRGQIATAVSQGAHDMKGGHARS